MRRIRLYYKDISEIVGSDGFSVARLTDENDSRAICVVCDKAMSEQMAIRYNQMPGRDQMLPEVLMQMLLEEGRNDDFELMVYDIKDGQYKVSLLNKRTLSLKSLRMSDAILLHYISQIPFYIEEQLMLRQCSPYTPDSNGIVVPINILDIDRLNKALKRAIEEEDYRLASHLHEEILRRSSQ